MLGTFSVPIRPTNLDNSRARAFCARSRCGWGWFGNFSHVYLLSIFSPSLEDGPIWTEILSQGAVKPKTTKQVTNRLFSILAVNTFY